MQLRDRSPEVALWFAVLQQAVLDLNGQAVEPKKSAERFIYEPNDTFDFVCHLIGVNANAFRKSARDPKITRVMSMANVWHGLNGQELDEQDARELSRRYARPQKERNHAGN